MMIKDTHKCESCGKPINWYYIVPNKMSSGRFDVEVLPADRVGLHSKPYKVEEGKYSLSCYCRACGYLNCFDYETSIELH